MDCFDCGAADCWIHHSATDRVYCETCFRERHLELRGEVNILGDCAVDGCRTPVDGPSRELCAEHSRNYAGCWQCGEVFHKDDLDYPQPGSDECYCVECLTAQNSPVRTVVPGPVQEEVVA